MRALETLLAGADRVGSKQQDGRSAISRPPSVSEALALGVMITRMPMMSRTLSIVLWLGSRSSLRNVDGTDLNRDWTSTLSSIPKREGAFSSCASNMLQRWRASDSPSGHTC